MMDHEDFLRAIRAGDEEASLECLKSFKTDNDEFFYSLIVFTNEYYKWNMPSVAKYFLENTRTELLTGTEIHNWNILYKLSERNNWVNIVARKHNHLLHNLHFWQSLATFNDYLTLSFDTQNLIPTESKGDALASLYNNNYINDHSNEICILEKNGYNLSSDTRIFEHYSNLPRECEAFTNPETVISRIKLANLVAAEMHESTNSYRCLRYQHHALEFSHFYLSHISREIFKGTLDPSKLNLNPILPEVLDQIEINPEMQIAFKEEFADLPPENAIKSMAAIIRHSSILQARYCNEVSYEHINTFSFTKESKIRILEELLPATQNEVSLLQF